MDRAAISDEVWIAARVSARGRGRESDKRYRDLVENIPAGVVVHGPGSEILLANQEASRLLGLSLDQLAGRVAIDPRWHFQHEDGRPFALNEYPVSRVLATLEAVENMVGGIHHPGGSRLMWVMCNAFPVFAPSGELSEVVVSLRDTKSSKLSGYSTTVSRGPMRCTRPPLQAMQ